MFEVYLLSKLLMNFEYITLFCMDNFDAVVEWILRNELHLHNASSRRTYQKMLGSIG